MTTATRTAVSASSQSRFAALALSAVLTLGMLTGINGLAVSDAPAGLAQQMAQAGTPRA